MNAKPKTRCESFACAMQGAESPVMRSLRESKRHETYNFGDTIQPFQVAFSENTKFSFRLPARHASNLAYQSALLLN
jgi:hypothetical protein